MTWYPYNYDKKQYLLRDGTVLTTPDMEQSGTRLRVVGTTKSFGSRQIDKAIRYAVEQAANERATTPWGGVVEFDRSGDATFHFLNDDSTNTQLWWLFRHPDHPIEMCVRIHVTKYYGGLTIHPEIAATRLTPSVLDDDSRIGYDSSRGWYHIRTATERNHVEELTRDDPPAWLVGFRPEFSQYRNHNDMRTGVRDLLARIRHFDDLTHVQIPDVSEDGASWLSLPLHNTNCTSSHIAMLVDFLDTEDAVGDIREAYDQLRMQLKRIGITLPEKDDDDLSYAIHGDHRELAAFIEVGHPDNYDDPTWEPGEVDTSHRVYFHLLTGTLAVACPKHDIRDEVALKWDEAMTIASLKGTENELLAYYRDQVADLADEKVKDHVKRKRLALSR